MEWQRGTSFDGSGGLTQYRKAAVAEHPNGRRRASGIGDSRGVPDCVGKADSAGRSRDAGMLDSAQYDTR
ncbi:hypothetical protein CH251_17905 [Rhodococcus sp. 06-462-5]|nr:hypothetical protein CH251_17905 [Rhodococcus sp. 06-462-5]OZE69241.1 hypothetical protein CH270_06105 [Rhodococcus sp. 02-925g]